MTTPRIRTRRTGAAVVVAALALTLGTSWSSAAGPSAVGPAAPLATKADCPEQALWARARCGRLAVPLDRDRTGSSTISVAYVLLPRTDRSRPSLGTVVPNPGGPGASTIDQAQTYAANLAPLLQRRDLLLVDPRGTGRSSPLGCTAASAVTSLGTPSSQIIAACGEELGVRAHSYGSAAVADDIEEVRKTLGLARLDLWGESYGTYLMPIYAARHPEHVQSIVLSGAYPIDFDPWGRDRLRAARRAITSVCARARECSGPRVLREVERLAARLRAHPRRFAVDVAGHRQPAVLDEAALAQLVYAGGDASTYGALPSAVHSALRGDRAPLRQLVARTQLQELALLHVPSFDVAAYAATACRDYPRVFDATDSPAARLEAYTRARDALTPADVWPFSAEGWIAAGFEGVDDCIGWPSPPTAAETLHHAPMPNVPVLVLSGELDANTPTEAGRMAAAAFTHARVLEVPNAGHVPTDDAECALAIAVQFVATSKARLGACAAARVDVASAAARHASQLQPVHAHARPAMRSTLAVVVATIEDLQRQSGIVRFFGQSDALRAGRYALLSEAGDTVALRRVRVVRDAQVGGRLTLADDHVAGTVELTGRGVLHGRLDLRLTGDGTGRASGRLEGRHVDVRFTM